MTSMLPTPNPYGVTERAKRVTERLLRTFLMAGGDAGDEISARMLGEAMLDDPDCQASRALRSLGVDLSAVPRAGRGPTPGPAEVMMLKFATAAGEAMRRAGDTAREQARPTSTGDIMLGLIEADQDWRRRLGVEPAGYQAALAGLEPED